jgi:hypothetical protein
MSSIRAFVPTLLVIAASFLFLMWLNDFLGTVDRLRPRLYLALAASWIVSTLVILPIFQCALRRKPFTWVKTAMMALFTVWLMFPCYGFFSSYAEEFARRSYIATGDEEKLFEGNLYFELHGLAPSRGAQDAGSNAVADLFFGAAFSALLLPVIMLFSKALYFQRNRSEQEET